ncbi:MULTISPECIES: DinB family protein [Streptomyces]|uniref:DinB family protein n=1 Tax=Streptomyces TaxID=1883 RepID=UPI0022706C9B|nr:MULTISPECIES: DinB family protein [unclassified Streptomyces]MCY0943825.1 DinB family protein [Streptomyces sp. H34-AA3]MCY0954643.1 DinB family protein [Streptomyces sp. H27-S2]MCZ4085717.1 DinB family protein [Streptomyces sp. H34-S5]
MIDEQRTPPVLTGDERATLTSVLQGQRDTLMMKCAGLSAEQLRRKAVAPSGLTLLGLVRHLAEVERSWFRNVLAGEEVPGHFPKNEANEWTEFHVDDADPAASFAIWEEACARSRAIVDAAGSLDAVGSWEDRTYSLHYILAHMIEEYARHNGHADLLREAIDGTTGE